MDRRQPDNLPVPSAQALPATRQRRDGRKPPSLHVHELAMVPPTGARRKQPGGLSRVRDWRLDPELLAGIDWQSDAIVYYRVVSQIRKVLNMKANTLAACRWTVKEIDPESGEPVDATDEGARRVWEALKGPQGGKRELARKFSVLADVGGEAFLIGVPTLDRLDAQAAEARGDSPQLSWEFVSRQELRQDRPSMTARRGVLFRDATGALSLSRDPIPGDAYIARWWQPDVAFTEQPDSCMRSVIPDAAEYVQLRDVVSGAIKSRMAAALLLVPDGEDSGPEDETLDEEADYDDEVDPFLADLESHMGAAVVDRTDPASYVPIILRGHPDDLKEVRLVDPSNAGKSIEWATPLREEKLQMIAQGLDAIPEALRGKSELNHWTGYSVDAEMNSKWVIPRGEQLASFLTDEYLRRMLRRYEGYSQEDAARFVVVFDPSNITARADKGVMWLRMYDRGLVSALSTVVANGGTVDDMPSTEEKATRLATDLVLRNPDLLPVFAEALGLDELDADLDKLQEALERSAGREGGRPPIAPPEEEPDGDEPDGDDGPIEEEDPESGGGDVPEEGPEGEPLSETPFERLVRDLTVAADAAAQRAVEKATSRVMGMAKKHPNSAVRDRMRNRDSGELLMLVSDAELADLGTSAEALLHGAWDAWTKRATPWISRWLSEELGVAQRDVGPMTAHLVDEIASRLQNALLDSGGDARFDGMLVPDEAVRKPIELEVGHLIRRPAPV